MTCPRCGAAGVDQEAECPRCRDGKACQECGAIQDSQANFCSRCGNPISRVSSLPPSALQGSVRVPAYLRHHVVASRAALSGAAAYRQAGLHQEQAWREIAWPFPRDGWPAGKYKLEVLVNRTPAGTKEFEVKTQS